MELSDRPQLVVNGKTKRELLLAAQQLSARGLLHTAKWVAELLASMKDVEIDYTQPVDPRLKDDELEEADAYILAKSCFDLKEYYRTAHFLRFCKSPRCVFLRNYSLYLAGEKRKQEEQQEVADKTVVHNRELAGLKEELSLLHKQRKLDGFSLYLYGVVLGHLAHQSAEISPRELTDDASAVFHPGPSRPALSAARAQQSIPLEDKEKKLAQQRAILIEAIRAYPWNWAAWLELAASLKDVVMLERVDRLLPSNHLFKPFWRAHALLELQQNEPALKLYHELAAVFPHSSYIRGQTAVANYNLQEYDVAEELLEQQLKLDPYRLTNLDTYSNILYVKNKPAKLSFLAYKASITEKYTAETCCIIGNYYSLKGEHEKAVLYFDRALKLNPKYLSVWTLMGHEYLELKNTAAAITAYRRAVDINRRDYRAWYGLGQTYEILQMPLYALYYFGKACELRPYDSRMWTAMAECYEAIGNIPNAILCYERAVTNRDPQGIALNKLAKLYEAMGDMDKAAYYYKRNLDLLDHGGAGETQDVIDALIVLARYCKSTGKLDDATKYCSRLLDFNVKEKEEAKALLREIHSMRIHTQPRDS